MKTFLEGAWRAGYVVWPAGRGRQAVPPLVAHRARTRASLLCCKFRLASARVVISADVPRRGACRTKARLGLRARRRRRGGQHILLVYALSRAPRTAV